MADEPSVRAAARDVALMSNGELADERGVGRAAMGALTTREQEIDGELWKRLRPKGSTEGTYFRATVFEVAGRETWDDEMKAEALRLLEEHKSRQWIAAHIRRGESSHQVRTYPRAAAAAKAATDAA